VHTITIKGKIKAQTIRTDGYLTVLLSNSQKEERVSVHRLVALHFIPNTKNKPQVDHIDRNRTNNHVDNLRWATQSENSVNSGRRRGKYKGVSENKNGCVKPYRARIMVNKKEISIGRYWTQKEAAIAYDKKAKEIFGNYATLNFED
jgi:hypothetical protein